MTATTTDRLSDSDALLWRIEGDPVLRSPILVVGLLDREPAWPRVRNALVRAAEEIPRFRQRLDPGGLGRPPQWVDDVDFSLDHHLRHVRAATPEGVRAVLDLAEPDAMTAFDPARPLWQLTVVSGLEGGRAAFVLRFHHTITDGVGGVALAEHLFDPTRRGRIRAAAPEPTPAPAAASRRPPIGQAANALAAAARAGLDPLGSAQAGVRMTRSIAKFLAPASEPLSPILRGRGLDRRLHVVEVPLDGMRATATAVGGTINDVFLAAVGGALRSYHETLGAPVDAIRVTMPINLRKAGDAAGGNKFTPARFVLPIDDPDPVRRSELAGAIVRSWRNEPAIGLTAGLAWALDRLPTSLVQRTFAGLLRSIDVDAVDVPGLSQPAFLGGSRVDRLWAFAPPTGAAMSITLVSHRDTACVGIAADLAAVGDPELLATCVEQALDEVLALGGHGHDVGREVPA
jgi:WS/DGAT/MGAT family acyltransferase